MVFWEVQDRKKKIMAGGKHLEESLILRNSKPRSRSLATGNYATAPVYLEAFCRYRSFNPRYLAARSEEEIRGNDMFYVAS